MRAFFLRPARALYPREPFVYFAVFIVLLYLDNSVLNRPFDDQRQPRVWL